MGRLAEIYGVPQGQEAKADVINKAQPNAEPRCPKCGSTSLFKPMGMDTVICQKCKREI